MEDNLLTAIVSIPENAGYFFPDRYFERIAGGQLYQVMIEKLERIPQIGQIIVNSDSGKIKSYYSHPGKVKVIDVYRPEPQEIESELTSDKPTAAILQHVQGEHFLQLGPIFPFLKHDTIERVIRVYDEYVLNPEDDRKNDSVFTIRTLNRRYFDTDTDFIREDRPNTFVEDGILHIFNRTTFLANGNRKVGKKPYVWGVEEIENQSIDSHDSYRVAVLIYDNRHLFPDIFRERY